MKQIGTCKIHFLSEALSPITHMMGVSGNESVLNREKTLFENNVVDVPVLSGNALRHKIIREPGSMHLVETCGLKGELSIDQANYMFTGGSLSESSTTDNISLIATIQKVSPLYRLLGGSLKNQIVGGSLFVSRGLLVCEENRQRIKKMCPSSLGNFDDNFHPAQSFIDKCQYTRGDASKMTDASETISGMKQDDKKNLMIYSGETIIPGAMFYHNLTLYNVSPLEVGAALYTANRWQRDGGIIGGSARIGHGKLLSSITIYGLMDWFGALRDPSELVADYCKHVEENKGRFVEWLNDAFGGKPTKKIKTKSAPVHTETDGVF